MSSRRVFLALALIAGLVAGAIYYSGTQRVPVLVAARELTPGRAIVEADLETRWLPPDVLPASAIADVGALVGRFPRGPLWPGQILVSSAVADSAALFEGGISVPYGLRAVAIPVGAQQALGGAIAPGARVDVVALSPGEVNTSPIPELVTEAALVIDVRNEDGGPLRARDETSSVAPIERLGSVVVAVPPTEALLIAERVPRSDFVLVLAPRAP